MSYEDIMFINRKFILWVLMFGGVVDPIKSTNRTSPNTPDSSFPTNRYWIEPRNEGGLGKRP
jgi:hypothetical protein